MKFTPKQQEVITTRNKNILVSAAAGSGKTSVLVERILSLVTDEKTPIDIDRFLIVTFTNAAAAEMRERIHKAILARLEENPADTNLQKQSALIHNAQITTIDSFCLFLLRNHFHEIGLDPAFRVGDQGEIKLIEKDVLEQTLEDFYKEGASDFLYFADAYCPDGKDGKIEKLVEDLYRFSMSHPWPVRWLDECEEDSRLLDEANIMESVWMRYGLQLARQKAEYAYEMTKDALTVCELPAGPYMYAVAAEADGKIIEALLQKLDDCNTAKDYEAVASYLQTPGWMRMPGKKDDSVSEELRDRVKDLRETYKKMIADIAKTVFSEQSIGDVLAREKEAGKLERTLIRITKTYIADLENAKRERNVLDFSDIEHYALKILLHDGEPTKTAEMYRDYYKTVMIDEYQDSNMVQELILATVSTQEKGKCNRFMVGDMKQSIYRFRMARPEIFMEKYEAYQSGDEDCSLICLKQNFRSRREVLDTTNGIFEHIMRPEIGGVVYDEEAALYQGAEYPDSQQCESELCLAVTEEAGSDDRRTAEAYMIASRIKELKQDFKVGGREVRYSDIVILLRSSGASERMKEVLMSEGIPAYVTSKTGYFSAMEINMLMDLLRIMNNPYDDVAFCSVATSLFFGFDNEELAWITAMTKRELSMYERFRSLTDEEKKVSCGLPVTVLMKIQNALDLLDELRERAVVRTMTELVSSIMTQFHYVEYVSALPAGQQRKANVDMFLQKTVDFEKTSYHGLFQFLRYMEQLKKYEVDFGEAATLTETADVVRIMTIHKSKGLEFPVCFVAGLDKQYNLRDTSAPFLMDADWGVAANRILPHEHITGKTMRKMIFAKKMKRDSIGEELRVLYVAMTRAKEKLILTAAVNADDDMVSGQYREETAKVSPEVIENAKTPLEHIYSGWMRNRDCLELRLVDMSSLKRYQEKSISGKMIREERIRMLEKCADSLSPEEKKKAEQLRERFLYRYPHETLSSLYTKTSVSELKHAAMEEEGVHVIFETEDTEKEYLPAFARETEQVFEGAARGSAMHRVLELLDFSVYADCANDLELCRTHLQQDVERFVSEGRMSREHADLLMEDKLTVFLSSELALRMAQAQKYGALFKEQPFVMSVHATRVNPDFPPEEKVLVQGIIDAYFEEDGEIVILDYKTDRVKTADELLGRYRTQLDYYEEAVTRLTGKKVKAKVIYSFALMETISWS
nr:helicase-exonuclease AddAB subunit AddA [Lachnospiraceae bacterium]